MPVLSDSTIVCIQSGNVNTGAFDPAAEICELAHQSGAWVHIDGAFGLWAAAAPERAYLIEGVAQADSWALDAHKWLNVPYDSGIVVCREEADLRAAMGYSASYLIIGEQREPGTFTPEMSRRARGIEIWAALLSLGRNGLADLIERTCCYAARFAEGLGAAGYQVLNEVKLNQVLVSFGKDETTRKVIQQVQQDGTCWCSGTNWQGRLAMRISVSCWATTADDVERSLKVMLKIASEQS
jgi:glutamate/tyrosine decarboxylase-like PLP-dependent enzyme